MILDQTKKMVIRVCLSAILFLGIIFGVLIPTLLSIKKTSDESYKLRLILEQRYEQSLRSRVTKQKLGEIKETIAGFSEFIFKSGNELSLITFLESLATTHRLEQTISNSNLDKIDKDQTAQISLSLVGNYPDILSYIADLESSRYFIYIEQMHIKPAFDKNGQANQIATLDLTIKLYVSK